jgi:hypothetical protein
MPNSLETVVNRMMQAFNLNYTGFIIDTPEKGKSIKAKLWIDMLRGYDVEVIKQATLQIIATRKNEYGWAPDIATVREVCLNLSSGFIATPNGHESWERILKKINEPRGYENGLQLAETEKRALSQTSSLEELRTGKIESLPFARQSYIKAFDAIVAKDRLEIMTPKSVRALVASRKPKSKQIGSPAKPKQLETSNVMTYDEALEEFGDDIKTLKGMVGE